MIQRGPTGEPLQKSPSGKTWLEPEDVTYPAGGCRRKGKARFPDGKIRSVRAGIADTFFSVPAHAKVKGQYVGGFVTISHEDQELEFVPYKQYDYLFEKRKGVTNSV